jgi:hypothetical protein
MNHCSKALVHKHPPSVHILWCIWVPVAHHSTARNRTTFRMPPPPTSNQHETNILWRVWVTSLIIMGSALSRLTENTACDTSCIVASRTTSLSPSNEVEHLSQKTVSYFCAIATVVWHHLHMCCIALRHPCMHGHEGNASTVLLRGARARTRPAVCRPVMPWANLSQYWVLISYCLFHGAFKSSKDILSNDRMISE